MEDKRKVTITRPVGFLGTHLLLELRNCDPKIFKNLNKVRRMMVSAAKMAKATIIDVSLHKLDSSEIVGGVIIAESHLSIRTWPEYSYAAVDIFTCGDIIKPEVAADYLIKKFKSKNPSIVKKKRGVLQGKGALKHKPDNVPLARLI